MTRHTALEQAKTMRAGMDFGRSRRLARQIAEMKSDAGRSFAKNATIGTAMLFAAIIALDSNAEALASAWNDRSAGPVFASAAPDRPAEARIADMLGTAVVETAAQPAPEPVRPCDSVLSDKVTALSRSSDIEDGKRAALDIVQHALSCPRASVTTSGSLELFEMGIADLEIRWSPVSSRLALSLIDGAASAESGVDTQFIGDAIVVSIR